MKKIVKMICTWIEVVLLFIAIGATLTAISKNIYSVFLIEQYKSKGVYSEELSTPSVKVYTIVSNEDRPTYTKVGNRIQPGGSGDILISLKSELQIPFVKDFVSFYAGGHAALVLDDYKDEKYTVNSNYVVETTGLSQGENNAIVSTKSGWADEYPYNEVIGLRVKMEDKELKKVVSHALSLVGDPYNYSFIANTRNKSYCSDLVMKAFSTIGVNLNKDGFTTSVYDLLVSNESYISYYHYFDKTGMKYIYYSV